jgi:hypothetical protein
MSHHDNPQGQPKPGQKENEQQKPQHQGQPESGEQRGRVYDTEPQRGERGDQESGKPVQLDK